MYKCTECGHEYNIKPDYCECGNDIFEIENESEEFYYNNTDYEYNDENKDYDTRDAINYSPVDRKSIAFFIICIILSFITIFFPGSSDSNKNSTDKTAEKKQPVLAAKSIPDIDDIWIESKQRKQSAKTISDDNKQKTSFPIVTKVVDSYTNATRHATNTAGNIVTNYGAANRTAAPQKVSEQSVSKYKPKTYNTQKATSKPVSKPVTSVKTVPVPKATEKKQTASTPKTTAKPKINTAAQQKEYANYKIGLRNKIASNINFATVTGDGNCVISFKLDSSGNLINRAFSQQSNNDSLNDAVYSAMMQTPSYRTPPAAYKNQTLKLSVKMYGGSFEVDLN